VKRSPERACGGYTLVELCVAAVLLVVALGSLTLFSDRSSDALGASSAQSDLDTRLRRTLMRVAEELLPSGFSVITPAASAPDGASTLDFRRSNGPVNGKNSWGPRMRFAFVYDAGELDDGLDNDHDGLVDEGVVQWTRGVGTADEQTVVLCRGVSEYGAGESPNGLDDDGDGLVDEHGFVFERVGDVLRIHLTLARPEPDGHVLTRTLETSLQPRN